MSRLLLCRIVTETPRTGVVSVRSNRTGTETTGVLLEIETVAGMSAKISSPRWDASPMT